MTVCITIDISVMNGIYLGSMIKGCEEGVYIGQQNHVVSKSVGR